MRTFQLACASAAGLLLAAIAPAQLLKNINQVPAPRAGYPEDSDPTAFVAANGRVYFSASTAATGRELFWVDGSGAPAQLLADIELGAGDSNPRDLVALPSGLLVFNAQSTATGEEIWVSDGTAAGTELLADIAVGTESSFARNLTVHGAHAYFVARSAGVFSPSLWRTDGTPAGTERLDDLGLTGSHSIGGQLIASAGSQLFYVAAHSVAGGGEWRLYTTDGSVGGSQLVARVSESSSYGPRELTAAGSRVVFVAQGIDTGLEIWVSDGTAPGTAMVDLQPGSTGSKPNGLIAAAGQVFFSAIEISGFPTTHQIFVSDGTVAGTRQVTTRPPSLPSGGPNPLAVLGNELLYRVYDAAYGNELWITGTTPGSARLYADFGPGSSDPLGAVPFGGGVLCQAKNAATGAELFFSDGTPAGTFLVKDIEPGTVSSWPHDLVVLGGQAFFGATTLQAGHEIWITDATLAGTRLHTDLAAVPFDQSSFPSNVANLGDRVVFAADDGVTGKELWASDGTGAGTVQLTDFNGSGDSLSTLSRFPIMPLGGRAVFGLDDGTRGTELWISDGTPAGTGLLFEATPGAQLSTATPLIEWRGEVYFVAGPTFGPHKLYATNGTATRSVGGFNRLGTQQPVEHHGRLFFAAFTAAAGLELWSTDGTAAGTAMVADVNPGPASGMNGFQAASLGDYVYFAGGQPGNLEELWRTDGTAAGTALFADLDPTFGSLPSDFHTVGDHVVFSARVNGNRQYYGTDGTTIEQLSSPPLSVNGNWVLYTNGQKVMGMLRGPGGSFNLWGTDGTPAGSGVIKEISPDGSVFVNLRAWRVSSGDKLLFGAGDAAVGHEIFITDGTTAGTKVMIDLAPGPASSLPSNVSRLANRLILSASDLVTGSELYELPWTLVDDWLAEPIGVGCPGSSGRAPTFDVQGSAQPGRTLDVGIERALPLAPVAHLWSADYRLSEVGGCGFYLAAPLSLAAGVTSPQGSTRLALPIPALPALLGQGFWLQSLVVDAGGQFLGRAALSSGLEIRVGG
ncbi:MAG: hypothetical protein AAF628_35405 [Planctomycetota bacterium]